MDARALFFSGVAALSTIACGAPSGDLEAPGLSHNVQRRDHDTDPEEDEDEDPARAARLRVRPSGTMLPFRPEGDFSEEALVRGVRATEEACSTVPQAVWVPSSPSENHGNENHGDCIRFWASGFDPAAPPTRALVFFPGDAYVGPGKTSASYTTLTPERLQRSADSWSKKLGVPFVFVGRPGAYGSSGDHMQRKRAYESLLVNAALDRIVSKLGLKEIVVAGQSGGGHVSASLITLRSDIVCAVPTSSPSSPRVRMKMRGWETDTTGFADSYEPIDHLDKSKMNPALRVFVVESPSDTKVPWQMQAILADRLNQMGVPAFVLQGEGSGPRHHGLSSSSRAIAGACTRGDSNDAIRALAAKGLKG